MVVGEDFEKQVWSVWAGTCTCAGTYLMWEPLQEQNREWCVLTIHCVVCEDTTVVCLSGHLPVCLSARLAVCLSARLPGQHPDPAE